MFLRFVYTWERCQSTWPVFKNAVVQKEHFLVFAKSWLFQCIITIISNRLYYIEINKYEFIFITNN